MEKKKLSLTYRMMRKMGLNYSEEEYGQATIGGVLGKFFGNYWHALMQSMMDWVIFAPIAARKIRPMLLRQMGAKVGKDCFIGDNVNFDRNHSNLITLEDHAHIASGTRLLCHQRILKDYCVGDDYAKLGYRYGEIILKKGSLVGMESFVMPGVTIGEGAIVGAGSLVTKDVPAWTIATGRPAKVVKEIPKREPKQD
ncbi:MAG: acyltransferase [Bacteroidales bacterium]|nr:acyltransferase [Bacteroidales bacterium]